MTYSLSMQVLSVSVYLYGEAAVDEKRKALPSVRAGEFEGLVEKVRLRFISGRQHTFVNVGVCQCLFHCQHLSMSVSVSMKVSMSVSVSVSMSTYNIYNECIYFLF